MCRAIVDQIASEMLPQGLGLPWQISGPFHLFHKVHSVWRWHLKTSQVYQSSGNFALLVTGCITNVFFGKTVILRIAAQSVLIARRIVDYVKQHRAFVRSWNKLCDAVRGKYYYRVTVHAGGPSGFLSAIFSASTATSWLVSYKLAVERTRRIWNGTANLMSEGFLLSMRLADVVEAFSISDSTRDESVNELFLNAVSLIGELVEDRANLIQELKDNREVIDKLLYYTHSQYSVENIIQQVENVADVAERVQTIGRVVRQTVNDSGSIASHVFLGI